MSFAKSRKKKPDTHGRQSDFTREEWLEWRAGGIGGSDAAVALGVHPYSCPLDLYLDKIKAKRKNVESNATRWGHTLEPLVINMVQERFPEVIQSVCELELMTDPDFPFLKATTDAGCFGSKGAGIIEAKTALSFHGGKMFSEGLPAHYRAQCLHYLLVSRLEFCVLGALTEGYREQFFWVFPDLEELEDLQTREIELWNRMNQNDIFWLLDESEKTAKALERLFETPVDAPEPLDKRGDETVNKALENYFEAKDVEKLATGKKKEAENILKATIGDLETLVCDGATVNWKRTARGRRFTVKKV
jgi:putative phage-type endonuclease